MPGEQYPLRIAILDLYDGVPNQGMRCIRELLKQYAADNHLNLEFEEFDVRKEGAVPDTSFPIYISTGGPGNPLDSVDSEWDQKYFALIRELETINASNNPNKKQVLFICHSFQLMCRYYEMGHICKRKSPSFGVFPVHKFEDGFKEPLFDGLADPFYVVDSREYQVIKPNTDKFAQKGAKILALEKKRPHVPMERALMAIRFSDYFMGTQFHPEADAIGMALYLQQEEKKKQVIKNIGVDKYHKMLDQLYDPDKIMLTHDRFIPAFLDRAINLILEPHAMV